MLIKSWQNTKFGNWMHDKNRKPFRMSEENQHLVCYFIYVTEEMKKNCDIEIPEDVIFVNELQNYYQETTGKPLNIEL